MSTVTNEEAVIGFKNRFGFAPKRRNDEHRRLGKAAVHLIRVQESFKWAQQCGIPDKEMAPIIADYQKLSVFADKMANFQNPDPGQVKAVKNGCKLLEKQIRDARAVMKVPNLPEGLSIYVRDIPGIDDLTPEQRQKKIAEVGECCIRGAKLLNFLNDFDPTQQPLPYAPTKQTVLDMSWYLMGKAQTKHGEAFHEGAMTISDPKGVIGRFFDLCPEIYPRDSSHLRQQQQQKGAQGRGIDNPGNYPAGLNTLLLHSFDTEHGERRLYLKFESAGSYAYVKKDRREVGRRTENAEDKEQSWEHFKSLIGMGYKPPGPKVSDTREGSVKHEVQKAYQDLYNMCPLLRTYLDPGKMTSKQDDKGEVTGKSRIMALTPGLKKFANSYWDVQTQLKNVNAALQSPELLSNPALAETFDTYYRLWKLALVNVGYIGDVQQRLGNEVVLGDDDLQPAASNLAGGADVAPQATMSMVELHDVQITNTCDLLSGSTSWMPFVYYEMLSFAEPTSGQRNRRGNAKFVVREHSLFVDTQALQFSDCVISEKLPVMGFMKKSVNLLGTVKIEYHGDVDQNNMFQALVNTKCPLGKIAGGADLARYP